MPSPSLALSNVTPPYQICENFQKGREIPKSVRQEEGTRAENRRPETIAAMTPLPTAAKGFVGVTVDTSSARYLWGRRDRGYMPQIQR